MDFRECEVFFFGTASKNGGNSSRSDCSDVGSVQLHGLGAVSSPRGKATAKSGRRTVRSSSVNNVLVVGSARAAMINECVESKVDFEVNAATA